MSIGQELLNVPMGDMIRQMALAIAEGQAQLDASSVEVAEMMGGLKTIYDSQGRLAFDDSRVFFGYEMMTIAEARAYVQVENALKTNSGDAIDDLVDAQESALQPSDRPTALIRVPTRLSMLELGFTPTFYQFVDTIIEVKIAIKITRSYESSTTSRRTSTNTYNSGNSSLFRSLFGGTNYNNSSVSTSQVDATYSSKYNYSAEGASLLRTKLVPLPPPSILEERIRRQLDVEVARRQRALNPA
jgi:hypothetical protein